MKETRLIMGMPITVDVPQGDAKGTVEKVFAYFEYVDRKFSTYKPDSEINRINRREINGANCSADMQTVFRLSEDTKNRTGGFFDIKTPSGAFDPSGLVKGWAIQQAALILKRDGVSRFFIEAGGDIQPAIGQGRPWRVGIRNPFNRNEIVKVLLVADEGVATSGTYIRGHHIYNPKDGKPVTGFMSLTVIGPDIYEADRFATAAFAMGERGIEFIDALPGFEGYMIDDNGTAVETRGFSRFASA